MINELKTAPRAALVIGGLGLLPFLGAAAAFWLATSEPVDAGLSTLAASTSLIYGAVILSFLGGTRWGREVHANPDSPAAITLALSVLPSIVGWVAAAISLPPSYPFWLSYVMLMGAFGATLAWDMAGARDGVWPKWYGPFRVILSTGAIIALGLVMMRILMLG